MIRIKAGGALIAAVLSLQVLADGVDAARAVIARFAGEEVAKDLKLELIPEERGLPVYEIADGGKTLRGSSPVAIAKAFYANVRAKGAGICSWTGDRFDAAAAFAPSADVRQVSPFKYHQYFNVVTYGYSLAYWDEARWMREIDWMALHGVDMPLLEIATEAIAERVWKRLGLTDQEIDDYLAGPAHMPWFRMGNLSETPDKQPKAWRERALRLQHKVLARMRELGMRPIGPAFAGFLPSAIQRVRPDVKLLKMSWIGHWHNYLLSPDHPAFREIGTMYVEEWEKEFGKFDFYLADSFNEMQIPWKGEEALCKGLKACGENIYGAIRDANPDASWVMQGWIFVNAGGVWNEKTLGALYSTVPKDKVIVLDLAVDYAQFFTGGKTPVMNWDKFKGFLGNNWVYSTIPNMGGCTDFTGVLDWYANGHLKALTSANRGNLVGYGMAPEGIENNEVIYELETDAGWRDTAVDIRKWLHLYTQSRYGRATAETDAYWDALLKGPYSQFRDHPRLRFQYPLSGPRIFFDVPVETTDKEYACWKDAVDALENARRDVGDSPLYRADVAETKALFLARDVDRYVMAERCATKAGDRATAERLRGLIRTNLLRMDDLMATHPCHRLERWLGFAREAAEGDEQLAEQYVKNAYRLVTVWGPPLDDYSSRVWSGLIRGFYLPRMEDFWRAESVGDTNVLAKVAARELKRVEAAGAAAPGEIVAPAKGAVVPVLTPRQKAHHDLPREERTVKFDEKAYRKALRGPDDEPGWHPVPLTLAWTGDSAAVYEVTIRRAKDGSLFRRMSVLGTSCTVDNFEIGCTYAWTVSGAGKAIGSTFTTEDRAPRILRDPTVPNVRDLGGRMTSFGRRVRQNRIFRTAGLNNNAYSPRGEEFVRMLDNLDEGPFKERLNSYRQTIAEFRRLSGSKEKIPYVTVDWGDGAWNVHDVVALSSSSLDSILAAGRTTPASSKVETGRDGFARLKGTGLVYLDRDFTASADGYALLDVTADWFWALEVNGRLYGDYYAKGNDIILTEFHHLLLPVKKGANHIGVVLKNGSGGWSLACRPAVPSAKDYAKPAAARLEKAMENLFTCKGPTRINGANEDFWWHQLGIRSDIDLRSEGECYGMTGSPLGPAVTWFSCSSACYTDFGAPWGREAFTKVFRVFLDEANYPIAFHCIAGQDRTGAVAYVLLALLGVEDEEIWKDWDTSGFWNAKTDWFNYKRFKTLVAVFDKYEGATTREKVEKHVLSLGFTQEDIEKFRSLMLEWDSRVAQ